MAFSSIHFGLIRDGPHSPLRELGSIGQLSEMLKYLHHGLLDRVFGILMVAENGVSNEKGAPFIGAYQFVEISWLPVEDSLDLLRLTQTNSPHLASYRQGP